MAMIKSQHYHHATSLMRDFFLSKNFCEVPAQCRTSILAACEDPATIATYDWRGVKWPLPQTGQMWLEYELLKNPDVPGFFCQSTSYRNEPNPEPGRHETIFPMFEFEIHGGMDRLEKIERELLEYMGFGKANNFAGDDYKNVADKFGVKELTNHQEELLGEEYGAAFFLKNFPQYTSPFWNMKKEGDLSKKIDVLLYGMETIGSAERSCNTDEMRHLFHTISDGGYAQKLYDIFGKERVEKELEEFLSYDFFPRSGGGIGVTRMIRALQKHGLLKDQSDLQKAA